MTSRRAIAFFVLVCLLAPAAQASELGEPYTWLPEWLLEFVEWICDNLGAEFPTNTTQGIGPETVPIG